MTHKLYGDGIHDDYPAIQQLLDSGASLVYLPVPQKNYVISKTLKIHSNQELRLDRFTRIKLADNANCTMLENGEVAEWNENIKVSGGIWDMNHENQAPNPLHFPTEATNGISVFKYMEEHTEWKRDKRMPYTAYTGMCIVFSSVKRLIISDLTIYNPVLFGIDISYTEDFTVENICFDYFEGSPKLWNMDGVHIEGYCKNGYIHNLKGACHDDTVAITSDDVVHGPIENIVVDGIYGQNSHSGVRILSVKNPLRNVHITNVFGTYYTYAVVLSKFHFHRPGRGHYENITIDHIYASICEGTKDVVGNEYPLVWIGREIDVDSLYLSHIFRNETHNPIPTIRIDRDTTVNNLYISHLKQTNETDKQMPVLENNGTVENLVFDNIISNEELIANNGEIKNFITK